MGVSRIWRLRLLACALAVASGQGARAEPPDTGVARYYREVGYLR